MPVLLKNNAKTVLAGSIGASDTIIPIRAGAGEKFPLPVAEDDWFPLALSDVDGNVEYMRAISRTGDAIRVVRGQEGTQPRPFGPGDIVDLRLTVAAIAEMCKCDGGGDLPKLRVADIRVVANIEKPRTDVNLFASGVKWAEMAKYGIDLPTPINYTPYDFTGVENYKIGCDLSQVASQLQGKRVVGMFVSMNVTYADDSNTAAPTVTIANENGSDSRTIDMQKVSPGTYEISYLEVSYVALPSPIGGVQSGYFTVQHRAVSPSSSPALIRIMELRLAVEDAP